MERSYRTLGETSELLRRYAREYEREARRAERAGNEVGAAACLGRAEAYEVAAFELDHNTR